MMQFGQVCTLLMPLLLHEFCIQGSAASHKAHRVPHCPLDGSRRHDYVIEPATSGQQYVDMRCQPEGHIHCLRTKKCIMTDQDFRGHPDAVI